MVDEHLATTAPGIHAAGDVAAAWHPGYRVRIRVEHWDNALHQGSVAEQPDIRRRRQAAHRVPTECRGGPDCRIPQVIEGPIPFYALCEHHALPFHGVAHIGYIPHEQISGISKLTRLVRLFARRFTVQERVGQQIADTLAGLLEPHGVAIHLQAVHLCTQMRGVNEDESKTWTSFWRGSYEHDSALREEFLQVCRASPR